MTPQTSILTAPLRTRRRAAHLLERPFVANDPGLIISETVAERTVAPPTPIRFHARPTVAVLGVHYVQTADGCLRGGAEKYLRTTVGGLLEAGANVHVNYSGDCIYRGLAPRDEGQRLILEKTDWLDDGLRGDRRLDWRTITARMRWLLAARPDVLFVVQQNHGTAFAASIVAAGLIGCPVVMSIRQMPAPDATEQMSTTDDGRFGLWRWIPELRMRTVARCCRSLIFNSRCIAEQFVARYQLPATRVCVIPNGEPLAAAPRSRMEPDPALFIHPRRADRVMLGAIGQLSHHKGTDLTLEAFSQVADRFASADLIYFGEGPLRETLQTRAAALGLSHRVTFARYATNREAAFANIDLFVLPSRRESSSNAVAEAMARGLPCIVSDVGGLPELVIEGVTGRVVPSQDIASLASAMTELLTSPPRRREMGDAGYRHAARHLNLDENMQATLATLL